MPLSNVKPENYEALLSAKTRQVESLLSSFEPPSATVIPSRPVGFRMRAEFRIWHEGSELDYVMFRKEDPKTPVPITHFPIGCNRIQDLMPRLISYLQSNTVLRRKLFQLEFLSTLAGDTLVTLIYHRKLDDEWRGEASTLATSLGVQLIGRSRRQKCVLERDFVVETLPIGERNYTYRQYEQAFTQPNAEVNIQMIEWACQCAQSLQGDLLELYCGNGNFTLPLASHFGQVIATELAKTSIRAARENLANNRIENVEMIRLSAEEVTQAIEGKRSFRRLAQLPRPLSTYELNTVFVDPPRAGLDSATEAMVSTFDSIIYISCNPQTLAHNLETLSVTHRIEKFALFDQFPYTEHMECGVLLRRR